ncbi:MAG: hypothetical protein JSU63_08040, partial [Phycisphaerales bacterium]
MSEFESILSSLVTLGLLLVASTQPAAAQTTCSESLNAPCWGVTVDTEGNIWCSGGSSATLTKTTPTGEVITYDSQRWSCSRGIAVTPADNHVWVAYNRKIDAGACKGDDDNVVLRYDSNGTLCETIEVGTLPTGVAVDGDGNVYVTNLTSCTVSRIIPSYRQPEDCTSGGPSQVDVAYAVGLGGRPDDYGTMTGLVALQTSGTGTWTTVHDGGVYGGRWARVDWSPDNTSQPPGTSLVVSVRAADTEAGLAGKPFVPVERDVPFTGVHGRYVEVQVRFYGSCEVGGDAVSPVLYDLTVSGDLDSPGDCNNNG